MGKQEETCIKEKPVVKASQEGGKMGEFSFEKLSNNNKNRASDGDNGAHKDKKRGDNEKKFEGNSGFKNGGFDFGKKKSDKGEANKSKNGGFDFGKMNFGKGDANKSKNGGFDFGKMNFGKGDANKSKNGGFDFGKMNFGKGDANKSKNGGFDFGNMNFGKGDANKSENGDASAGKKGADDNSQDDSSQNVPGGGGVQGSQGSSRPDQSGEQVHVDETIVVGSGEVFDGEGKTYVAGSALGDGGQSEGQKPVFKIEDGGALKNVNLIGENGGAADGVHTYGDAEIDNVHWLDVGEDALTKKEPGDVVISNSSMANGDDKGIQDNAGGSIKVINSHFENLGKAYRQNGGKDFPASVEFVNSTFSNIDEAIARSDSPNFSAKIVDSEWDNVGEVFMAPDSADTSIE